MRFTKLMAAGCFGLTLLAPGVAAADDGKLASLHETVRGLEERAQAIRVRAEKTHSPLLKRECERIVKVVDTERVFVATRLQIFGLSGSKPSDELVAQTEARASRASMLLSLVERWFLPR